MPSQPGDERRRETASDTKIQTSLLLFVWPQHNKILTAKDRFFLFLCPFSCQEAKPFWRHSCKKRHRTQTTVSLLDPISTLFSPVFFFPPTGLFSGGKNYTPLPFSFSKRKVIFFLFCTPPFMCCVNVSFTERAWKVIGGNLPLWLHKPFFLYLFFLARNWSVFKEMQKQMGT